MKILPIHLASATPEEYHQLAELENLMRLERQPEDPPIPEEEQITRWQSVPPIVSIFAWQVPAPDTSHLAGYASTQIINTEENKHMAQFEIHVRPEYRRQTIGSRLLANVAAVAQQNNRRLLITETEARVPAGAEFMRTLGARPGLEGHFNQLEMQDLDVALMRSWLAAVPSTYELGLWEGRYPDDEIEAIAELYNVMNTQPFDDLEIDAFNYTPDFIRQIESANFAAGNQHWTYYARHKESNALAGFTDVYWHPNRPEFLIQADTGVFPEHRGNKLGRSMKAAMILYIQKTRPEVKRVRTRNANSNVPMLKINQEMGFKNYRSITLWQLETERAIDYCGRKI